MSRSFRFLQRKYGKAEPENQANKKEFGIDMSTIETSKRSELAKRRKKMVESQNLMLVKTVVSDKTVDKNERKEPNENAKKRNKLRKQARSGMLMCCFQ